MPSKIAPINAFSRHALAWFAVSLALGVIAAGPAAIGWLPALALALLFAFFAYAFRGRTFAGWLAAAAFVFAGAFCIQYEASRIGDDRIRSIYDRGLVASGSPVEIEGQIVRRPEPAIDGTFIRLSVSAIRGNEFERGVTGIVRLFVPLAETDQKDDLASFELRAGTRISVICELIREDQYLNPGVLPRRQLLDQQGIDATATVKNPLLIEPLAGDGSLSAADVLYGFRGALIDEFRDRFSPRTAGVLIASLLGDKHFLDRETAEVFREGGTFHVLVISGLHITFIGGLLLWAISLVTLDRLIHLVLVGGILWSYAIAVGGEVPVIRACVMFTAFLVSRVIYRSGNLINALGLSCLVLMVWRPSDVFTPSFQLTVVSVASIVTIAFPLIEKLRAIGSWMPDARRPFPPNVPTWLKRGCETLYWREEAWEADQEREIWSGRILKYPYFPKIAEFAKTAAAYIVEGLIVSLIVQICMLPLSIHYFHRATPAGIFLNLWTGLFLAIESFAAILAVVVGLFSDEIAFPFSAVTEACNWLLLTVPAIVGGIDWASFRVPVYSGGLRAIYPAYFIPVIGAAYLLYRLDPFALRRPVRTVWAAAASVSACLIVGAVIVFHPFSPPRPDGSLHVEFLDVGQGDSAFITFPDGQTMLIDGGGIARMRDDGDDENEDRIEPDIPRIGEMVVSEFLWEKGYSRVDHLVASHADADHSQGLADIINNFRVGAVYIGAWPRGGSELDELFAAAKKRSVPIMQIGRGDRFEIDGVKIETIWPIRGRELSGSDNNSSIVMRMLFGERSFLFTGDIEKESEVALADGSAVLNADVVKVPHHGSRTSSTEEFVSRTKPAWAIVPVGRRSRFGHPHADVVERWKNSGTRLIRTGDKGTVTFTTNGHDLSVRTFLP